MVFHLFSPDHEWSFFFLHPGFRSFQSLVYVCLAPSIVVAAAQRCEERSVSWRRLSSGCTDYSGACLVDRIQQ